jgi:hypothetical protein
MGDHGNLHASAGKCPAWRYQALQLAVLMEAHIAEKLHALSMHFSGY